MKSKIILFGGTFDPIHNGHLRIAHSALVSLNADKVIFIPAKNPRWKEPIDISHRSAMLKLALKGEPNYQISDFELKSDDRVNYTIDTVKHFKELEPEATLYFLIGFDQVDNLNKWHGIDELAKLVDFIAVARPGYPENHEFIKKYQIKVIEIEEIDVSSSRIRELCSLDTPKTIIDYIITNELYFVKTVKSYLGNERYLHSLRVADVAYEIAKNNGVDCGDTYLAAYLHDIARDMNDGQLAKIMEKAFPQFLDLPQYAYHQFVGSYIANQYFKVMNEKILDAIKYHTTGKKSMNRISKIIYASDKIEPGRGYDSRHMIKAMNENLIYGFKLVLRENKDYIAKELSANRLSEECYHYYLKED